MPKVIVFGAAGQLGQCLKLVSGERDFSEIIFLSEEKANILDADGLKLIFSEYKPQYCINCAAYTAVDKAEDEPLQAEKINVEGVRNLSKLCAEHQVILIHISTDFVFAGNANQPLSEEDEAAPISVYGQTKLAGERLMPTYLSRYFIFRTSWLYSEYSNNFVKTMLRLGKERESLGVIWDQLGSPTYAPDLAGVILDLIQKEHQQWGIYHYSNEGVASWYDFAEAVFTISKTPVKVLPLRTADYGAKAKRPAYSVMDKLKIKKSLNIEIPHWRDSLEKCISKL